MNVEGRIITPDDRALFRDVSLRALADPPDAFRTTLAEAQAFTEDFWRQRAEGSPGGAGRRPRGHDGWRLHSPDSSVAYIWGMWTAPEARGRGYAAGLLENLVNWCRDRGLGVSLHVTEGNEAARRLYVADGFKPTGVWEPLREGSALRVEELQLVE